MAMPALKPTTTPDAVRVELEPPVATATAESLLDHTSPIVMSCNVMEAPTHNVESPVSACGATGIVLTVTIAVAIVAPED